MNETTYQNTVWEKAEPTKSAEDLGRIFNTVMVASLAQSNRDFSGEFSRIMESPAFKSILGAIQAHSRSEQIPTRQAAEQIIQAFRQIDDLWKAYVYSEGVDRLGGTR